LRGGLFCNYSPGPVSSLACDADVWLRLNNNDTELASDRVKATESVVETVLNFTRSNKTISRPLVALSELGELTWRDLIALLSWRRLNVSVEDDDEEDGYLFSLFD
jgi:hypothetical protein